MTAFIETQFPIARLSAESYKEHRANSSQTLTGFGKWWGRKPLILVRASILGILMPASCDAKKDREIFLKILTMDDEGVWQRVKEAGSGAPWRNEGMQISRCAFDALSYADRLRYCQRRRTSKGHQRAPGRRSMPILTPRPPVFLN